MFCATGRILNKIVAGIALLILSPVLLLVSLLLLLTGEHEVLYLQSRVGYKNRPFKIWKFATMLKKSPSMGMGSLTLRDDPRVTRVGKYLRITKINEFPQLANVLLGNMSFVGPRPQMKVDFDCYPEHVQERIYQVTPGITGIGSIVFRDEEEILSRCSLSPQECYQRLISPYKGELELWYQDHRTPMTDTLLILLTAWAIVKPKSDLVFRVFKSLPPKPAFMEEAWAGEELELVGGAQGEPQRGRIPIAEVAAGSRRDSTSVVAETGESMPSSIAEG